MQYLDYFIFLLDLQERRKFFPITFLGSILWIGFFSYLMVWWANQVGETISIPTEVRLSTIVLSAEIRFTVSYLYIEYRDM